MINEETLGFVTNPYPYLPKPAPVVMVTGFLGVGVWVGPKNPRVTRDIPYK